MECIYNIIGTQIKYETFSTSVQFSGNGLQVKSIEILAKSFGFNVSELGRDENSNIVTIEIY